VLEWAVDRSGTDRVQLEREFKQLRGDQEVRPVLSISALERLSKRTRTPLGNFFLDQPPQIDLGMVEFRGPVNRARKDPSPELVETVAQVRELQEWYREFLIDTNASPVQVVNSISRSMSIGEAAAKLDKHIGYTESKATSVHTYRGHWSSFASLMESAGIAVMKNGVVGNNTHRPLSIDEFQAFSISDDYAPVVFINGKDEDSASVFSLAHELTHIGLGIQSLTRVLPERVPTTAVDIESMSNLERWCNAVAAELLVPASILNADFMPDQNLESEVSRLSRHYQVSRFVILIKLRDEKHIPPDVFRNHYANLLKSWKAYSAEEKSKSKGGDAYRTMAVRFSKSITRTLIEETIYGRTTYAEALELLRLSKASTISSWADRLGIV
jgi:Zn-dependent peptidase ImmA (M78 family)